MVRCAIYYHLYNLKNVENEHGGVLILVKITNGTKSRNASNLQWNYFHKGTSSMFGKVVNASLAPIPLLIMVLH